MVGIFISIVTAALLLFTTLLVPSFGVLDILTALLLGNLISLLLLGFKFSH